MGVFYSSGSNGGSGTPVIPEYYSDPMSPTPEEAWVLATVVTPGHTGGSPIGLLLALTYATTVATVYSYQFSYKTLEGPIVRVALT